MSSAKFCPFRLDLIVLSNLRWVKLGAAMFVLTHYGLETPYGDIGLG